MRISTKSCTKIELLLSALLLLTALVSLGAGASGASLFTSLSDALRGENTAAARILLYIRLPRTLAAMLAGSALACSGALIQGVLGNPLAGPNLIGVNAGAGLSALVVACLFPTAAALLPLSAFLGAMAASLLLLLLTGRGASRLTVVLAGVAISAIFSALGDCVKTLYPDAAVNATGFFIGSFSGLSAARLRAAAWYILPALALSLRAARHLDALLLGDDIAQSIGMRVRRTRALLLMLASVLAGAAVSFAGLLGFVGLLIPHAARRVAGAEHRRLLPLSMLSGALLVLVCDLLCRTAFAPHELPVGILLSLVGAPFFLVLLLRAKREEL